ncbi:hypothetical protein F511_25772 [Dorcoceras hygrometricum]|uniref:Uncharacterized protein n=1 Tax=Dorcoceras hygrometricum TaxID=472368 RepID=A0A2Z7AQW6_9LAMI|nr:hypothetical protein F511_25772 [Dorcoceras hygrometricum]
MASSLINNTIQVYFDSVLEMDNEDMVVMFEALISSGLSGFLGCSSAIFKTALVEFFHNVSVRDGVVVSTIQGKPVAILEELFTSTFELKMVGLSDLHEVPQDLVLEARHAFSYDGKLVSTSYKKRELVFEFRLLNDILANSVTVKVGSFDVVTHESDDFGGWVVADHRRVDYWSPITRPVDSCTWELLPQRPYIDDLTPLCAFIEPVQDLDSRSPFSRVVRDLWAEVCVAFVQFLLLGALRPVGTVNCCKDIVGPIVDIEPLIQVLPEVESVSSDGSTVYRSPSPISKPSISSQGADPTASVVQIDTASINHMQFEQIRQKDDGEHLKDMIFMEIRSLEKKLTEMLEQQDNFYRALFKNVRQEIQIQKNALSLDILTAQRKLSAQQIAVVTGLDDIRKDVKDQKAALYTELEDRLDALGELVAYINRGGNEKKGEVASSPLLEIEAEAVGVAEAQISAIEWINSVIGLKLSTSGIWIS